MNHYECLSIISGKYAETEVGPIIVSLEDCIKKHTSPIHYVQNLERRKLAYPINHNSYGYYILVEFDSEPGMLPNIDRELTLNNDIIRHIIVKRETVGKPKDLDHVREREIEKPNAAHKQAVSELDSLAPLNLDDGLSLDVPVGAPSMPLHANIQKDEMLIPTESALESSEDETTKESSKKKQSKVSYEDLDKKLDEILGNDII